jgi:exonuclease III
MGLEYQAAPNTSPTTNTVLVAASEEFKAQPIEVLGQDAHRIVLARFDDLCLFAVYFPLRHAKQPLFDYLLALPRKYLETDTLLVGDFNTGLHREDEVGATFYCAKSFGDLTAKGWVDVWRAQHGRNREYSWYSNRGNGFRVDHVFSSPVASQRVRNVRYSHEERESGMSDHSTLIAEVVSDRGQ